MKTAEEWNKIIGDAAEQKGGFDTYDDMEGFIKQIQADAQKHGEQIGWKKGMSEAATMMEKGLQTEDDNGVKYWGNIGELKTHESILTARDSTNNL